MKKTKIIFMILQFFIFLLYGQDKNTNSNSLPLIYTSKYNISIFGIENFHPFDSKKYKKVYKDLIKSNLVNKNQVIKPSLVTQDELLLVHTEEYLKSLRKSSEVSQILEIPPLKYLPNFILHRKILKPMKYATGGTILGLKMALETGWAINLSGGYHHAKSDRGEGFCVYADVPIALHTIWKTYPTLKALIIDLDAHQGNGNSAILGKDSRVAIFDMYNKYIYPNDVSAESLVTYKIPLQRNTGTKEYLELLHKWLPNSITEFNPDVIIYNAGTDIYLKDNLGNLSITKEGIIKRDEYVFTIAKNHKIPILMVLSGGYHKESGHIIAESVQNILKMQGITKSHKQF